MTYQQAIDYLYTSQPAFHLVGAAAYKPGLDNTYRLMEHLGNPHQRLRCIHIAGTNGKGSTSHLIAAVLQAQGYRVGLFTSPHLVDFRERIRISGTMIAETDVVQFVTAHQTFLDTIRPSFFETTMAMAFNYFAEQQVDIAVIEVGLGGRLDSTNIITPLLSIITNIGFDHTEFLGNTLASIATEKAGIIKPHTPCVIGETHHATQDVFLNRARECQIMGEGLETTHCRIWFADQCGFLRRQRIKEVAHCQLTGDYQDLNQQTAYVSLQVLRNICHIPLSKESIIEGFSHVCELTGLRGRWEILSYNPLTICDTGHNGHGLTYVSRQLQTLLASHRQQRANVVLRIVLGMVNDKDVDMVMRMLPTDACYYFTQAATTRAIPSQQLKLQWMELHPNDHTCQCSDTVQNAIQTAMQDTSADDIIFIGGSNYVVGEALSSHVIVTSCEATRLSGVISNDSLSTKDN